MIHTAPHKIGIAPSGVKSLGKNRWEPKDFLMAIRVGCGKMCAVHKGCREGL